MDLKELLKKFYDAGIMAEATLEEKYSFEQTLADNSEALKLQQTGVIVQSEQLKTCEHNFTDIYDNTGTQIVGKKCLNGCGF